MPVLPKCGDTSLPAVSGPRRAVCAAGFSGEGGREKAFGATAGDSVSRRRGASCGVRPGPKEAVRQIRFFFRLLPGGANAVGERVRELAGGLFPVSERRAFRIRR